MTDTLIQGDYSPLLVTLSLLVASLASFVAIDTAPRIWAASGLRRHVWLLLAALAMGGGIWSMHFIGMLAFMLPVDVTYDLGLTFGSVVLAVGGAAAGFIIIGRQGSPLAVLTAGIFLGLGVVSMHYTGMEAMNMQAMVSYDPLLVGLSVLFAVAAATTAVWITIRVSGFWWRILSALIMGLAVYGMHYIGMEAAMFHAQPALAPAHGGYQVDPYVLAFVIAFGTIAILMLQLVTTAVDRRFTAYREREAVILRQSEARFRRLVENASDFIFVVDAQGTIQFASCPNSGLSEKAEGSELYELLQGPAVEDLVARLAQSTSGETWAHAEGTYLTLPGRGRREFEVTARNLMDDPAVMGTVLTLHDITHRQRAAAELQYAKNLSDEANRVKSEFIANMSHELRTPLTAILGFSDLIRSQAFGPLPNERYLEYADDIYNSGSQLLAIINDILDISRIEAGQLDLNEETLQAQELVQDSLRILEQKAQKKGVALIDSCKAELPEFSGDGRRLRQVLINLVGNAVKFTPSGGQIRVIVQQDSDGGMVFSVQDTGIGIPEDKLAQVTKPFFQVDGTLARQHEGVGLGLAISRSLIEMHGGTLVAESTPGQGTTFHFTLPVRRVQAWAAA
ncbi:MHYT domain-containing protein [Fodinicurvata fenggangensis]|uniref:MHYT domain-containing protein n=1 Tax=Fodinicurvata fenggangensis TaxID=1121830 RepID=UPI00047B9D89|nr:MHYT domain-containing protein [Fodinicurvata fenggangensis]